MAIKLEEQGARLYLRGDTFAHKDKIKSIGGHWDSDAKAWWVGTAKRTDVQALVERLNGASVAAATAERENGIKTDARVIIGRVSYEGKTYYAMALGNNRETGKPYAKLAFRDGSRVFWAKDAAAVTVLKRYDEPTSIDALRRYAERMKQRDAAGERGGGCDCSDGCCDRGCRCGPECNCRGGNIYNC